MNTHGNTKDPKVKFDLEGFTEALIRESAQLRRINKGQVGDINLITNGRESGLLLAKALLEQYTVRKPL